MVLFHIYKAQIPQFLGLSGYGLPLGAKHLRQIGDAELHLDQHPIIRRDTVVPGQLV